MKTYLNAMITTLGEHRKHGDTYTQYDYIELLVEEQVIQVRSVIVHDSINAGLIPGLEADLVFAEYFIYDTFSLAVQVNECLTLKTSRLERNYYQTLITELNDTPTLLKLIPWILAMPIRALRGPSNGSGVNPIGVIFLIYWVVIATPFVAPFTYLMRRKRYWELKAQTKHFFDKNTAHPLFNLPRELDS